VSLVVDGGGTGQLGLKLTRFESSDLEVALPWFEDPETSRWLGDGDWLRLMVAMTDLPLIEFRGANETERFGWLAWNGDEPIGYLDCGTYDRWTTWDGERVISAIKFPQHRSRTRWIPCADGVDTGSRCWRLC
jgi:hypothetical protein